jgi:hypothetical protein
LYLFYRFFSAEKKENRAADALRSAAGKSALPQRKAPGCRQKRGGERTKKKRRQNKDKT